jgi:ribosomal protein S18 acetylase RimI-like enzyme
MRIVVATVSEIDDVALLLAAQFEEHSIAFDQSVLRAAIRGAASQPARGEFLLARDDRSLGLAYLAYTWTLEHGGLSAWLEELYVIPEARSHGIGSRLLRSAMAHAKTAGCAAIDLEVASDHARAAHLYARAGFRQHQRARWYLTL